MLFYTKTPIEDEVRYMRAITRNALWDVVAAEKSLQEAHALVACAKALLARGNYTFTADEAAAEYEDQIDDPETPEDWAKSIIGSTINRIDDCEQRLTSAHAQLAAVKIMLVRGNYTEFSFDDLAKEMAERYRTGQGIGD